jgi:hypothetical protein
MLDGTVIGGNVDAEVDKEVKTVQLGPETLDDGTENAKEIKSISRTRFPVQRRYIYICTVELPATLGTPKGTHNKTMLLGNSTDDTHVVADPASTGHHDRAGPLEKRQGPRNCAPVQEPAGTP